MFMRIAFMVFVVSAVCLSVKWAGPYCFVGRECESIFTCAVGERHGVYLWAVPWDRFLVYCVGENGVSFAARMLQHPQAYLSRVYRVFEPEELGVGRKVLVWGEMWKRERQAARFLGVS